LIDLARAELNSLLDMASSSGRGEDGHDADEDLYRRYGLSELTDEQLEAELERRRRTREEAARAARARADESARAAKARADESYRRASAARPASSGEEVRKAYGALEVPYGSDFVTVRKSYRALMRKYHPDRHGQSPEKQKAANELAQRLTAAYRVLGRHLRK
jgi:DnaJ-domain-containing protein 1